MVFPNAITLKPDTRLRRRYFVPESNQHQAKMHLGLLWEIAERVTKKGDWILDPMSGIGSTLFLAALGRNVVCNEIEVAFSLITDANYRKIVATGPMLGYTLGGMAYYFGDARNLLTLWPLERPTFYFSNGGGQDFLGFSAIITSPPYEEAMSGGGIAKRGAWHDEKLKDRVYSRDVMVASDGNISRLRGQAFWDALLEIYRAATSLLRPDGVVVLVVRDVVRDGAFVGLPERNTALMEALGFSVVDHWFRAVVHLSFWRHVQAKRGLPTPDREEVLVFKRSIEGGTKV